MYLLDSNVLSELRTSKRCHPQVKKWEASVTLESCYLSVTTILETRKGIEQMHRTRNLADCLVAATALEHRLHMVTRNVSDFKGIKNLNLINPGQTA